MNNLCVKTKEKEAVMPFIGNPYKGKLVSRSFVSLGRRTSARLEYEFWEALRKICEIEKCTLSQLLSYIENNKYEEGKLSSSIRIFVLNYFMSASTEEGHALTRHGNMFSFNLSKKIQHHNSKKISDVKEKVSA